MLPGARASAAARARRSTLPWPADGEETAAVAAALSSVGPRLYRCEQLRPSVCLFGFSLLGRFIGRRDNIFQEEEEEEKWRNSWGDK